MRNVSAFQPNGVKHFELASTGLFSDANLVSYWKLEDLTDSVGSNTWTNNNTATFSSAKFNSGVNLVKASSQTLSTTTTPVTGTADKTISCWVKANSFGTSGNVAVAFGGQTSNNGILIGFQASGKPTAWLAGGLGTSQLNSIMSTGTWYHLLAVYKTSGIQLYLNGSLVATGASNSMNVSGTNGNFIGNYQNYDSNWGFDGQIDDVAVFSRALSATEVSYLYSLGTTKAYYPLNKVQANPELASTSLFSDANLVSYWKLEGNSNDSIGSNNGTDTSVTYGNAYGKFGQGALFNGSTSKITHSATSFPTGAGARTWSVWFKATTLPTSGNSMILTYYGANSTNNANGLNIVNSGGTMQAGFFGYANDYTENYAFTTGVWYHISGTFDGTTAKIYVNGSLLGSGSNRSTWNTTAGTGIIGQLNGGASPFNGQIDDVAVFSRALSATEVQTLYGYGTTAIDYSGNGNHGTETNITYTQGRFGQGARFGGSGSYIVVPDSSSLDATSAMTVSFWMNPAVINTSQKAILSKWSWVSPNANQRSWVIHSDVSSTANNLLFLISPNGTTETDSLTASSLGMIIGNWYHFVCVYDGSNQIIYKNGLEVARRNYSSGIYSSTAPLWIGDWSSNGSTATGNPVPNGTKLDEVIIESRAWTAKEVETYYRKSVLNYRKQGFLSKLLQSFSISETLSLTENVSNIRTRLFSIAETTTLSETVSALKGLAFSVSESLGLVEAYNYAQTFVFSVSDTLGLTEVTVSVSKLWNNITKSVTSWTTNSKSSTTWTDRSKNSSSWTNRNKS